MKIIVNGTTKECDNSTTVLELLKEISLENKLVVVEINGEIVDKGDFSSYMINDGDRIEIIRFVGGG